MKMPIPCWLRRTLFCGASLLLSIARTHADDDSPGNLRVGFFLLHDVVDEETQVSMIGMVKTMPDDVHDYVNRVSREAKMDLDSIDEMEERRPALKLEKNPLPEFEQKVRGGIRDDKQHQLLFGTKGPAFARALLVTQIEASNYILQIAKQLADEDSSGRAAAGLKNISVRWTRIRDEGFTLLGSQ